MNNNSIKTIKVYLSIKTYDINNVDDATRI